MRFACWVALPLFFALGAGLSFAQTIRVEAETATLSGPDLKVVSSTASDPNAQGRSGPVPASGDAYLTGFSSQADQATVHFVAKTAGLYRLTVAYRSQGRKGYDMSVNGLHITGSFAPSASTFSVLDAGNVEVNEGQNEIAIFRGWGFFDVDYLELKRVGTVPAPAQPAALPVDRAITPAARDLLQRLDRSFGKTTMLGVYSNQDAEYVRATTGVLPAIMGGDLIDYSPQRAVHQQRPNHETERLIADFKQGYTITLSWHWASPSGQMNTEAEPWWKSFYTEATTYDLTKVLADPSGKDYALMLSDIDTIAMQLKKLQDAGIPVLWRPLHEASGGWFWWGAKGPKAFVQLWRILYDRLTQVDGIHNLIWVYTGDDDPLWYPGDKYVDVIGIDQYPKDLRDPANSLWEQLQAEHEGSKPITISEFGGVPDIPRMQRMGEFWSYAVSWSGKEGPRKNTPEELKRIYTSGGVTTMAAPAVEKDTPDASTRPAAPTR